MGVPGRGDRRAHPRSRASDRAIHAKHKGFPEVQRLLGWAQGPVSLSTWFARFALGSGIGDVVSGGHMADRAWRAVARVGRRAAVGLRWPAHVTRRSASLVSMRQIAVSEFRGGGIRSSTSRQPIGCDAMTPVRTED
jgi:hypothetical protein